MNTYVAAEIISKETNVRFYAITNNGRQKRLIAGWIFSKKKETELRALIAG